MDQAIEDQIAERPTAAPSLWERWQRVPLYVRIILALALGVVFGRALGDHAKVLAVPAKLIIRLLGALAPPLILVAVIHSLMTAKLGAGIAFRLARLLLLNTLVAIGIGLLVANTVRPGEAAHLTPDLGKPAEQKTDFDNFVDKLTEAVPESLYKPLVDNNVIAIVLIGVAFGLALRSEREQPVHTAVHLVELAYRAILKVLTWVIGLVPLAVFGVVAGVVGTMGFAPFRALGAFVVAVVLALLLQAVWYLARIRLLSWVRPMKLLADMRDAIVMAFATDSSTATMPVTYKCLVEKVGVSEQSARLGALIGTNFNNDGTALYEAMSALFIAQLLGRHLGFGQQLAVVGLSIIASVGAAGIPEAGTVTMALVFKAVGLPLEYIPLLLTVDWFLDRSRTVINMMGDVNVSCLLEGRLPLPPRERAGVRVEREESKMA
ncbi:MAG: dicarboxylate/amino acid:cation symporter [Phycisphaerales bacterium]|nr:dicarboxylate/amino acid:cation symporter [Phycisphaerales bacterium]MDB5353745.1 dicarboxylate/amino acid:cation symporter [Phycisphaerales bacterium]